MIKKYKMPTRKKQKTKNKQRWPENLWYRVSKGSATHTDEWRATFQCKNSLPSVGLETHQKVSEASLGIWLPTQIKM